MPLGWWAETQVCLDEQRVAHKILECASEAVTKARERERHDATNEVDDSIHGTNVGQEVVAQALALRSSAH